MTQLQSASQIPGGRKLVLFDLDGTLTDPRLGITSGVQHALRKFGIDEPDLAKLEPFIGPPLRQSFQEAYGLSEEDAKQAVSYYREYFDPVGWSENKVYAGIPEALAALQDAGYTIGLATSKPTVFAERILTHFGLRDWFSIVVGSNLDGTRENKADVIAAALEEAGIVTEQRTENGTDSGGGANAGGVGDDAGRVGAAGSGTDAGADVTVIGAEVTGTDVTVIDAEVTMVGDRKYDIIGGKKWGLRTIGVTYGYGSREELQEAGADLIVDAPGELVNAVMSRK